jgi:hypothetical protein
MMAMAFLFVGMLGDCFNMPPLCHVRRAVATTQSREFGWSEVVGFHDEASRAGRRNTVTPPVGPSMGQS